MKRTLLLLTLVLLSACVAETVERRRPRKGPIEEVGFVDMGGGDLRYSVEGWGWFVAGRRRDALRRMRKNCGKLLAPQVLDEYLRQDADIAYSGDDLTVNLARGMEHFKIAPYQHMIYECRQKGAPADPLHISTAPVRVILTVPPAAEVSTATVAVPVAVPSISTGAATLEPK